MRKVYRIPTAVLAVLSIALLFFPIIEVDYSIGGSGVLGTLIGAVTQNSLTGNAQFGITDFFKKSSTKYDTSAFLKSQVFAHLKPLLISIAVVFGIAVLLMLVLLIFSSLKDNYKGNLIIMGSSAACMIYSLIAFKHAASVLVANPNAIIKMLGKLGNLVGITDINLTAGFWLPFFALILNAIVNIVFALNKDDMKKVTVKSVEGKNDKSPQKSKKTAVKKK